MNIKLFLIMGIVMGGIACDVNTSEKADATPPTSPVQSRMISSVPSPTIIDTKIYNIYTWMENFAPENALVNRIPVPARYERKSIKKSSFADWLRHLPLKPDGTNVRYFNDVPKPNQGVHTAVIDIDTGKKDLQQCADAVMRLKAEYHYGLEEYRQIHFNYTSGDLVSFDDWRYGRKPIVAGSDVTFTARKKQADNSYKNFKKYMRAIFNYAGTYSLSKEMLNVPLNDMQIGDVFIQGGFPGHAVIVVDIAVHADTGKRLFLLAQSYMPAQDIHILINPNNATLSPWYSIDFQGDLHTPEWTFTRGDLKRFAQN